MTTLKKNTLAIALVAAMGFAANASAFTVTTSGDAVPEMVATFDIASNATVIDTTESLEISLDNSATEYVLARTTGLNIVIELSNGAKFNATPTAGETVIGAPNNTWSASVIAGGAGSNFITVKLDPANPATGLVPGALVSFTTEHLFNLSALQTSGQTVNATVTFVDPNTAQPLPLYTSKSTAVLQSGDPTVLSCDPSTGDLYSRIDVGTNGGNYASKTTFSYYGDINGGGSYYFDAGEITVDRDPAFASFVYQGTDEFTTTLTGNFSAFVGGTVWMYDDCGGNNIQGVVAADGSSVEFNYLGSDLATNAGGCWHVEFWNGAGDVIDATTVTAQTTFVRPTVATANGADCGLLPMQYNGSVVKVATYNPGGNATQQSFMRITNPSDVAGMVTIDGTDDNGASGDSAVTLMLGAGESVQINADTLEAGGTAGTHALTGALGDHDGKWRLVVTGEFAGMRVASLNRNTTDGTVTDLTDYDTAQEQNAPTTCDWNCGISSYSGSDSY